MRKVFFDTNIMIDVIGRREQFCRPSLQIMSLADRGLIRVYVSAKHEDIDYIITRNKKDFTASDIPVFEPQEFVDYLLKTGG